jgi:hypothetical protein
LNTGARKNGSEEQVDAGGEGEGGGRRKSEGICVMGLVMGKEKEELVVI